jgi:hypothetical protein
MTKQIKGWRVVKKKISTSKSSNYYKRWYPEQSLHALVPVNKHAEKTIKRLDEDEFKAKVKNDLIKEKEIKLGEKKSRPANKTSGGSFIANTLGF